MPLSSYDAWVTREPPDYEPPPQPHCSHCGGFLPRRPDMSVPFEQGFECSGEVRIHHEPYTEGLVAILGEEYRGKTYEIQVSDCGIDQGPHAPHREVVAAGVFETRICKRCGHRNETSEL